MSGAQTLSQRGSFAFALLPHLETRRMDTYIASIWDQKGASWLGFLATPKQAWSTVKTRKSLKMLGSEQSHSQDAKY